MWVNAHAEAMAGIQAEEALREAEIVAVGGGHLEKAAADRVMRRWRTALDGGGGGKRLTGTKADLGILEALGVKVRTDGSR
jgi:hypothetical protein